MLRTLSSYALLKTAGGDVSFVESVPIPGAKSVPEGRFVGAYGVQGTHKMFQELRRAVPSGATLRRVDVKVEIGDSQNPMVTMERLASSKAIHLNKLSVDLQHTLRSLLKVPEPTTLAQYIAHDPSLLNILWADPLFSHLKVICWQHPTRSNPQFQLGAIASPECVQVVEVMNRPSANTKLHFFPSAELCSQ